MAAGTTRAPAIGPAARTGRASRRAASRRGRRYVLPAAVAVALIVVVADALVPHRLETAVAWDARVYWQALHDPEPYLGARLGILGSYLYSPAFLLLLAPAGVLPWPAFLAGWAALQSLVGLWLLELVPLRHRWALPILAIACLAEIWAGNIHLFLAAAVVIGLRSPPAWAFVALTKVTPVICLAWFAFRREWRSLALAVGATLAVVGVSALVDGWEWVAWLEMLLGQGRPAAFSLSLPLPIGLLAAVLILAWAAPRGRTWALPVACMLALPAIWPISLSLLVASPILGRVNRSA